ncbi:2-succinyl-6-hydroxy-2,4-cyclohexadiene-1-carboxylate synthase [Staphylococcus pasteuri]|uniref:2-succinyl-6-hydroxy-2, 4-cyclohexadiene-1-carboxylate synthase n=1 Tax=Staphylococcus pasteuri TaxID=45972 RepID=UPI002DBA0944|nr:2-succinyl-6-hydroxy-2,4-cyclohexadiene-1-carboxylate synthase [Staphylococcus pasteuri]MEB7434059.1 2-succinyl-6-hydroxy-2,4-cyclohexadiene-1-carboxylate synthase [Staphylococcus pasteuri]
MLHHKFYSSNKPSNQLLIMLHGFISDGSTFDSHIDTLTKQVNVLTVDLPGHGNDDSPMDQEWNFSYISQQLDQILSEYHQYHQYLLGYSMGGRVSLYYALHGTNELSGLILESTSPGIQKEEDQIERQQVDNARAKVLEIAGLEIFVNDWERLPLFASQYDLDKSVKKQIRQNRMNQDPSKLAKALRDYGTGQMPNLWPSLINIQIPTIILAGQKDEKFVNIAQKMNEQIINSRKTIVSEAGHTIHVEDSAEFDTIILGFLKEEQND